MTPEEARRTLDRLYQYVSTEVQQSLDVADRAMEKQIPKKPKRTEHWTMCPACFEKYGFTYDILVGMTGIRSGACFCLNCGQRIDMTKEKEKAKK